MNVFIKYICFVGGLILAVICGHFLPPTLDDRRWMSLYFFLKEIWICCGPLLTIVGLLTCAASQSMCGIFSSDSSFSQHQSNHTDSSSCNFLFNFLLIAHESWKIERNWIQFVSNLSSLVLMLMAGYVQRDFACDASVFLSNSLLFFAQMAVTISPEFVWKDRVHGASERWHIWVEVEILLEPKYLFRLSTAFHCSIICSIYTSSFVDFDLFKVSFLSLVSSERRLCRIQCCVCL